MKLRFRNIFYIPGLILLSSLCLNAYTVSISENTYHYKYPSEYNGEINLGTIIITNNSDKDYQYNQDSPIKIKLNLNAEFIDNGFNITSDNEAANLYVSFTINENLMTITLNDTLQPQQNLKISGIYLKNIHMTSSSGTVQLLNQSNEVIANSEKEIIFADIFIDLEPDVFLAAGSVSNEISIKITDADTPILDSGRVIYLKMDKNITWEFLAGTYSKIKPVSSSSTVMQLQVLEDFNPSETVEGIILKIKPTNSAEYDISLIGSLISDTNSDYLDQSVNQIHFALPAIEINENISFVQGDFNIPLNGLTIVNDATVDAFYNGQEFYITLPESDDGSLRWSEAPVVNGISFEIIDSGCTLKGICTTNHNVNSTIDFGTGKIITDGYLTAFSVMFYLKNTSNTINTTHTVQIHIPEVKLAKANRYIYTDPAARLLSDITISNSSPGSIFYSGRSITISLPDELIWDNNHLPTNPNCFVSLVNNQNIQVEINNRISGDLILSGGKVKVAIENGNYKQLIVNWNDNSQDYLSDNYIYVLKPSEVSIQRTNWIAGDGTNRALGKVSINFNQLPFIDGYYLFIRIPDTNAATFYTAFTGPSWSTESTIYNNNKILRLKVSNYSLSNIELSGLAINIPNAPESFKLQLALLETDYWSEQDWESADSITVYEPTIVLTSDNIIVNQINDEICTDIQPLANIILGENQGITMDNRSVEIILPDGMTWYGYSSNYGLFSVNNNIINMDFNSAAQSTRKAEITGISIRHNILLTEGISRVIVKFDGNSNEFRAENLIRIGSFTAAQADTSFIVGDTLAILPEFTLQMTTEMLIPGYSIILKAGSVNYLRNIEPIVNVKDLKWLSTTSTEMTFDINESISSDINIKGINILAPNNVTSRGLTWYLQKDGRSTSRINIFESTAQIGDVSLKYVSMNHQDFRYPTYIKDDPNSRKFSAIQIIDIDQKGIFRKGRSFTLMLPDSIIWENTGTNKYVYTIDEDNPADTINVNNLGVKNFQKEINSQMSVIINNNSRDFIINEHEIKVVYPELTFDEDIITETQTFWLNEDGSSANWLLRTLLFRNPKDNGLLPGIGFRIRLKDNTDYVMFDKCISAHYNSLDIVDNIYKTYDNKEIFWNYNDSYSLTDGIIVLDSLWITALRTFDDLRFQICLTEAPYYYVDVTPILHCSNPSVEIENTAFLVGDSGQKFPTITLDNLGYISVTETDTARLILCLPDDFNANWANTKSKNSAWYYYDFSVSNINNKINIEDIAIDSCTSISPYGALELRSSEYMYAENPETAIRRSTGRVKIGNPHVYWHGRNPDEKPSFRFCYNDPVTTIDSIVIREDEVAALMKDDKITIKIDSADGFNGEFVENVLNMSDVFEVLSIESDKIIINVKEDLKENMPYYVGNIQLGYFTDNTEKQHTIKVHFRSPDEPGHPIKIIGKFEIGKPDVIFLDANLYNEYYLSSESEDLRLSYPIKITDDRYFPVMDAEGILLKLESLSDKSPALTWNAELFNNKQPVWFKGSGISHLSTNRVECRDSILFVDITSPFNVSDSLLFKPFNFRNTGNGGIKIKVSNNRGASWLDSCNFYISNPICKMQQGGQRILKTIGTAITNEIQLDSVYGLRDFLWIEIPQDLECQWDADSLYKIEIYLNGFDCMGNGGPAAPLNDVGQRRLMQIPLKNVRPDTLGSLTIKYLPLFIPMNINSGKDSLILIWDSPYSRKFTKRCEDYIILGAPSVNLITTHDILLYPCDTMYTLPVLMIQDDPNFPFINGGETFRFMFPVDTLSFETDELIIITQNQDTIAPTPIGSGNLITIKMPDDDDIIAHLPFRLKNLKLKVNHPGIMRGRRLNYEFENKSLNQESYTIALVKPIIKFDKNIHTYIEPDGNIHNIGKITLSDSIVSSLRQGQSLILSLQPEKVQDTLFQWRAIHNDDFSRTESQRSEVKFALNNYTNNKTHFRDIILSVDWNEIRNYPDYLNNFPDSLRLKINFRPYDNQQPAWIESENYITIHLPVFYSNPAFTDSLITYWIIKDYVKPKPGNYWTNRMINFEVSDGFNLDREGIQYVVNIDTVSDLCQVNYSFNDSALFEINRIFRDFRSCNSGATTKKMKLAFQSDCGNLTNETDTVLFPWYESDVSFSGYVPYDNNSLSENHYYTNSIDSFNLLIKADREHTFYTTAINLCTGDTTLHNSDTTGKNYYPPKDILDAEGLYIIRIDGKSSDTNTPIFPYYQYVMLDSTIPEIDINSIFPSQKRAKNKRGLTISKYDSLKFKVGDNFKIGADGFTLYQDLTTNPIHLDYSFIIDNPIIFSTVFCETSSGIFSRLYSSHLSGLINSKSSCSLLDENNITVWPIDSLVTTDQSGNIEIFIQVSDICGNSDSTVLAYYYVKTKDELENLTDYIFNYPNPFSAIGGTGTSFRYVVVTEGLEDGKLVIFDAGGDIVYYKKLDNTALFPGIHDNIKWDGKSIYGEPVASGVYFAYFEIKGQTDKKVTRFKIAVDNRK